MATLISGFIGKYRIVRRVDTLPLHKRVGLMVAAVIGSMLVSSILIIPLGVNPLIAYYELFKGAWGSKLALSETLVRFTPLLFTGVAVALAFLARFWNIGAEGQLYLGAMFATFFGISFYGIPSYVIIPLMLIAGFIGGSAAAFIPALLRCKYGIDEVVTTLLLNWVIYFIMQAIIYGPWRNPVSAWPESPAIAQEAELMRILPGTRLHLGLFIAISIAMLYYIVYSKSYWGFELKLIGLNPKAASVQGIDVVRNMMIAALVSGGIAGLAGAVELMGIHFHLREALSHGYGYTGIVIAMLGLLHPIGVVLASFFMATIETGSQAMHRTTGIPYPLAFVIEGITLIFALIAVFFMEYKVEKVGGAK